MAIPPVSPILSTLPRSVGLAAMGTAIKGVGSGFRVSDVHDDPAQRNPILKREATMLGLSFTLATVAHMAVRPAIDVLARKKPLVGEILDGAVTFASMVLSESFSRKLTGYKAPRLTPAAPTVPALPGNSLQTASPSFFMGFQGRQAPPSPVSPTAAPLAPSGFTYYA